jgi:hypothetical protein
MAGTIDFEDGSWGASGGTFRSMAIGVIANLPATDSGLRTKSVIEAAVESNLMHLDFDQDFDAQMKEAFTRSLQAYLASVESDGAESLDNPALFVGHVNKLKELLQAVQRNVT